MGAQGSAVLAFVLAAQFAIYSQFVFAYRLYERKLQTIFCTAGIWKHSRRLLSRVPRIALCRLIDTSSNADSAFMLGNHHIVCSRAAHRLRVSFVARSGYHMQVGIERLGRNRDVEIVGVIVDQCADTPRALDSRRFQDAVPFRVA